MCAYNKQQHPKGWLSPTQSTNLYITLGLATELLARKDKKFSKQDGAPNMLKIARHLENDATKPEVHERVIGQSSSAIRRRLDKALKIKNENS